MLVALFVVHFVVVVDIFVAFLFVVGVAVVVITDVATVLLCTCVVDGGTCVVVAVSDIVVAVVVVIGTHTCGIHITVVVV